MPTASIKYNRILSVYFSGKPLYLDKSVREKPNTRKLVEQPYQQTNAQLWDEVTQTLCDICFIEAKCASGMTFELISDYYKTWNDIPDNQSKIAEIRGNTEKINRWTNDLIDYSRRRNQHWALSVNVPLVNPDETQIPNPPPASHIWSQEEIEVECQRIIENPTRLDKLSLFKEFVASQYYPLIKHSWLKGFVRQHACNIQPSGQIHDLAMTALSDDKCIHSLRTWPSEASFNPMPAIFRAIVGEAFNVNVSPDGSKVVFVSRSLINYTNNIQVWDLDMLHCTSVWDVHFREIRCMHITPDCRSAVLAGVIEEIGNESKRGLCVLDLTNGQRLKTLEIETFSFREVFVTPDGHYAITLEMIERKELGYFKAGRSGIEIMDGIRVWDLNSGKCLNTIEVPSWKETSMSITPDGTYALLAGSGGGAGGVILSDDKTLHLLNLKNGQCLKKLDLNLGQHRSITDFIISLDGKYGMTLSGNTLRRWDLENEQCIQTIEGVSAYKMSATPDWQYLIAYSNKIIQLWDLKSGLCLRVFEGEGGTDGVYIAPDGRSAVSWGSGIRKWNIQSGSSRETLNNHSGQVISTIITLDGHKAISLDSISLQIRDLRTGQFLMNIKKEKTYINCVDLTPDGNYAVSGGRSVSEQVMDVWDLTSGTCLRNFGGKTEIKKICLTPDGTKVVAACSDENVRVWDMSGGHELWKYEGHYSAISCLIISHDGRLAVTAGGGIQYGSTANQDCTIRVWDMKNGQCLRIMEGHTNFVSCILEIPGSNCIISGSWDHTLRIWDLKSGKCIHVMEEFTTFSIKSSPNCLCLTPDSHYAIYGGTMFGKLLMWDLKSGKMVRSFSGNHGFRINCVCMSRNGRYLISGSEKSMHVWDINNGNCVAICYTNVPVISLDFYSPASLVVCGLATGEVEIFEIQGIEFNLIENHKTETNSTDKKTWKFW